VPRILLAEAHAPTREYVAASLSEAGFDVVTAGDPQRAYEIYASERPDAVVLGADAGGEAAALARRLRDANPRVLLVVTDREHLGKARGLPALLPMKANAYVADPTRRDLAEKLQHLVAHRAAPARPRGIARVLARAPTARGEVKPGVVPGLFHQVWRSVSAGILVLESTGAARRVCFAHGVPVMAHSDDPEEALLRWMRQSGRLDAAAHDAALEAMAGGLSPGAALIAAGVIEPGEPLQALLAEHLRTLVVRMVGAREGRWRFHPGTEFLSDGPSIELAPLKVVLEGARLGMPARHFADALKAVTDAYPVRTVDFQQVLPAAGLASADLRLALALDGRLTTREWLEARSAEMKDALSLLWFLSLVGAVVFRDAPEADGAYGKAVPRKKRPLPPERGEAIRQAALRILPGTYLHALGVELDADAAAVEEAYRTVASRFHPDAFAEYDVAELSDLLSAIQDKLAAAYRVLADDERRRAYLEYLLARLEQTGARRPGVDLQAERALKRGERALHRRRHREAVAALREAAQRNPREPEYLAMLAFALLFDPAQPAAGRGHEARKLARRALALAPDHPRASAALALAEEALGDVAEARKLTLAALRVHPQNEVLKRVLFRLNRARG
jgi:CheY-like chemotaxis protein/tetratricopeptide (TPR) repeat protein